MGADHARLEEIAGCAASLRPFLEERWRAFKASSPRPYDAFEAESKGMCGFTSAFVAEAMRQAVGGDWRVAGGLARPGSYSAYGHLWTVSDDGELVDLTADQFGMPSVIVTTVRDPRFTETYCEEDIGRHLPMVQPLSLRWIEEAVDEGLVPASRALAA